MPSLGIDLGSTNLKLCLIADDGTILQHPVLTHDGDLKAALERGLNRLGLDASSPVRALVTGTEGRHRFRLPTRIAPEAIERALIACGPTAEGARAVVSLGGEDLVAYALDGARHIGNVVAGNKCASGTGEFFRQQLGRMNLAIDDLDRVATGARVLRLSSRCSVFMKSDCTHRLNKGEASVGDIALSLSKVLADKVGDFLGKARIDRGLVLLVGGVAQNRHLVAFLAEAWPQVRFEVPPTAPYFEAWGAALLARDVGAPLPAFDEILRERATLAWGHFEPLQSYEAQVRFMPSQRAPFDPGARYILGVDGGSTTTKVALVNMDTLEVVASHYGRTHGNPVAALGLCLHEVKAQLGGVVPRIALAATTGSSRELLGTFLQSPGVYNEIIAHTVGTTRFDPAVDTLFEIGGQDAKYVSLHNAVPIDYAMNEACSAGTGSFLEESAQGDLNIGSAKEIGPIALLAEGPLRFGQHCSAFINSDIRKAIQQGAASADIVAGLVCSVVANYLHRVVGNRRIGERIALQGGVACNPAVPLAFAQMTGKTIVVPPEPELMGAYGVALLAKRKWEEGSLPVATDDRYDLDAILARELVERSTFVCKRCDDRCEIRILEVNGARYPFGGRCSRYTQVRKRQQVDGARPEEVVAPEDYIAARQEMLFATFVPAADDFVPRSDRVVGVPLALSVHSLWPLYAWYFHHLGVKAVLSEGISRAGLTRVESTYCFPAELAHGAVADLLERGIDTLFIPLFRDMPSMEAAPVHACVCPLTQGLPFYLRQAFDLDEARLLRTLVSFKDGWDASREAFAQVAVQLGLRASDGAAAYDRAVVAYRRFLSAYRALGQQVLAEIAAQPERLYVAVMGRPYNAFTRDANMGIPRKLISHGVSVVPFDLIYAADDEIFPNMYWYYGQMDMKAVVQVKRSPNLYLTWVTNFSCAPDSFMLHYVRWIMGQKPYLVLEIDSHTADAGIDTRIEAFLDIVASYRSAGLGAEQARPAPRFKVHFKTNYLDVEDTRTGQRLDVRDPRVQMVFPSMGELSASALAAVARKQGIHARHLPVPTADTTQRAREVASGKECIPALLVLGSILSFFREVPPNRPDEVFLVFVPSTLGPCRTGQYFVFYERLFADLGWENVVVLVLGSENAYREMGPTFNRDVWWALLTADVMGDIRTGVELLAEFPEHALATFDACYQEVLVGLERGGLALERALSRCARTLRAIPRRRNLAALRKVLVVGEIYVRRDDFSVDELKRYLIGQDIFPKVTDVTEWVHYTDYSRKILMDSQVRRQGPVQALRSGLLREEAIYYVEKAYKDWVRWRIRARFAKTGFLPDAPHDMRHIVDTASAHFIPPDLESEATVSSGVAAVAMEEGYSGIAVVAPFACLPGRVIEGVFGPWARRRGIPVIALESDGLPYPPSTMARMEVFAHNVARHNPVVDPAR